MARITDKPFARYYTYCEDHHKRWSWNGFAKWLREQREGKQLPLAPRGKS